MILIRPVVLAGLRRGRETIAAFAVVALGLWFAWLGGYLLVPLGLGIVAIGAAWALQALRRLRFAQSGDSPGMIEVDEGQIGYLGPDAGGFVGLPDLVELRLISLHGRRLWRLKQADGQALLVPVDAAGAERLFDAFASLPGMDTQALVVALEPKPETQAGKSGLAVVSDSFVIWRRPARAALT